MPKQPYRSIPESAGGTYTFSPTTTGTRWIGTSQLITCVGVYLPISPTRCFVAHINALVRKNELDTRDVSKEQGEEFQARVVRMLRAEAEKGAWRVDDVSKCLAEDGSRKIVVMCPVLGTDAFPCSGRYVIQGIKAFLGPSLAAGVSEEHCGELAVQGFVMNHADGEVRVLEQRWESNRNGGKMRVDEEDGEFEPVGEYPSQQRGEHRDWAVILEEG